MKSQVNVKLPFLLSFIFLILLSPKFSQAQYYNNNNYNNGYYGGGYGGSPYGGNYNTPYNYVPSCLQGTGCLPSYQANTIVGLGMQAIDYGLSLHNYSKAREAQIQASQYQAEAARSNNPYQLQQDYNNIQQVAPFFDGVENSLTPSKPTAAAAAPKSPSLKTSSSERRPAR